VLRREGVTLWRHIASALQHDIGAGVYQPVAQPSCRNTLA